jgi:branched-chain amino acid transport system ATP-binding protein
VSAVLRTTGVSVSFGGVRALVDVDLDVEDGQLVGLIGPNGAGKTTFIDAISGFVPARGRIELDGRDVSGLAPHRRARRGLARTWQSVELFDDLTVRENLTVASHHPSVLDTLKEMVSGSAVSLEDADAALRLLGLESEAEAMPSELSQAHRKLVGIARALAARPRVICLDEPAAGLDTNESAQLAGRLRQVVDGGTSMLLVDHDMGLVLGISDHVVVLEFGEVIARGAPDEVRRDQRVIEAYLGAAAQAAAAEVATAEAAPVVSEAP